MLFSEETVREFILEAAQRGGRIFFGTVEAVKTVSDLFMPISGEILEFNESLETNPEKVNDNPYEDGWMIKIKISDASELEDLLSPEDYENTIS